jgi:hypothetical protein
LYSDPVIYVLTKYSRYFSWGVIVKDHLYFPKDLEKVKKDGLSIAYSALRLYNLKAAFLGQFVEDEYLKLQLLEEN